MSAYFKPVRRTHLISPFGVGAMVDFPRDEALMTAGLDAWPFAMEECPPEWKVVEERLQRRLGVTHFRLPPDFRQESDYDDRYRRQQIPYVRFPRWHFCPDPACGQMDYLELLGEGQRRCRSSKHKDMPDSRRPRLVPVRFVAICPAGHIEDFPFMEWVHKGPVHGGREEHFLTYNAGNSAALSGIQIKCSCGARQSLAGAFEFEIETGGPLNRIGYDCRGDQPWLNRSNGSGDYCGQFLRVVQRGGSNVYFPHILSSIYLPLWAEQVDPKIIRALEDSRIWSVLSSGLEDGKYISREKAIAVASMRDLDVDKLVAAAQNKLDGDKGDDTETTEENYRISEYEAFRTGRGDESSDLLIETRSIDEYSGWMKDYFSQICLLRKLRETRVLSAFSRLLPPDAETFSRELQSLQRSSNIKWLPATVVRGEGVFLEFRREAIDDWISSNSSVLERAEHLFAQYNQARLARGLSHAAVTPKLVLLHTFAHLLIRQLSFDCGYGSSALRERIYCDLDEGSDWMAGVLIYTAAGDAEGTMGGLVRKGEPGSFEPSVSSAIRNAEWCSTDPVCIETSGQGTDNSNLAACHACALVPETSCEMGNRLLDRALLIGKPGNSKLGYFSNL